jgi:hypothetical protein
MDCDRLKTNIWTFSYLALQKLTWSLYYRPKKIHLKFGLPTPGMPPTAQLFLLTTHKKETVSSRNPRTIPTIQDFYHLGASVVQKI